MDYFNAKDKDILAALSSNSRVTVTELSRITGLSRITVTKRINYLIEKLQIRFILEVDESKLQSFEKHIIQIKFERKPGIGLLKKFFEKDKYAQNVYLTEGDFDLVVYAAARSGIEYIVWETRLASELSEYGTSIKPSEYVTSHFGFMPLNNIFVDAVGSDNKVDEKDRDILRLLNQDSRMSYSAIAEATRMNEDTVRYRIFSIKKNGIIKRFTMAAQKPPGDYSSVFYFVNYIFNKSTSSESFAGARRLFFNSDSDMQLLNAFQFISPMSGSFRSVGMTLFPNKTEALKRTVEAQKDIFRREKPELRYGIVKSVLKGLLPFRTLNIRENYKHIEWADSKKEQL